MDARETAGSPWPQRQRAPARLLLAGFVFLATGAACWTIWQVQHSHSGGSAVDSLKTQEWPQSEWKNARLDTAYVGDAACVLCHKEIAERYRRHPMGRSLAPVTMATTAGSPGKSDGGVVSFDAGSFHYSVQTRGGRLFHKESRRDEQGRAVAGVENEVKYAIGSGTRGIAYLIEHDGRLFQSPIAWYSQKERWDLSPGYQLHNFHFDRTIEPQCLFCHANRIEPVERTVNRYKEPIFEGFSIGCERCHGPGAVHVRGQETVAGRDVTIVNPRHLEPALRDAVCEQCHLQGDYRIERPGRSAFDYRPGLPLSTFMTVLERSSKRGNKAVGHVEQMHSSRCFRESRGEMGCISCHDPHQVPASEERTSYYRRQCLACHDQKPCSLAKPERLAKSRDDNCLQCHMPVASNTDVIHNATTDHRILRMPPDAVPEPSGSAAAGPLLELFHASQLDPREREAMARELAIGLAYEARKLRAPSQRARLVQPALALLDQALTLYPDDLVALRAKAQILALTGRAREGLRLYDVMLAQAPDYEQALDERVALALELGEERSALSPALRAVAVNPWSAEFHERLAHYQVESGKWNEAAREAGEALRLNPFLVFARQFRVQCLLHGKDLPRAIEEFKILTTVNPTDRDTWQLWFARERRKFGASLAKDAIR